MSEDREGRQEQQQLLAALEESCSQSAWILTRCMEQGGEYFASRPDLLEKVRERLDRGNELVEAGNYRAANVIQRHAIDLILQEDHSVFKSSARLREALLRYRQHDQNVIVPLWEGHNERPA